MVDGDSTILTSHAPSPVSSTESLVDDGDVEEWEDGSSDGSEDVNEGGSDEEDWCDEDNNPIEAEGGAVEDVEALGFS